MPVPALKVGELVTKLNAALYGGKRLGDLDRYEINKYIEATFHKNPVSSLVLRAALAHYDGDIDAAISDFKSAIKLAPKSLEAHSNFAVLLGRSGYSEEASEEIRISLELCKETSMWVSLEPLVVTAVNIGDMEAVSEIVRLANKLKIPSRLILDAALILSIESAPDEDAVEMLQKMLSASGDEESCSPISDEDWANMKSFADELSHYVD